MADAKRAVEIGCTGIVLSTHGGRQLDGSRAAFDKLAESWSVGDRSRVMDGGSSAEPLLKALSRGPRLLAWTLLSFPLAAAGQAR